MKIDGILQDSQWRRFQRLEILRTFINFTPLARQAFSPYYYYYYTHTHTQGNGMGAVCSERLKADGF